MSAEQAFSLCNPIAMLGWVLLIVAPRRAWASLIAGRVIPLVLAGAYLVVLAVNWSGSEGGFGSLPEVSALFANPWLLLAGWIHYLAFDLFIGAWELRDAADRNISHWLLIPCLLLTFLFGPVGLLTYFALRAAANAWRPSGNSV
jgi:ABA DEFICIENT 4-like